MNKQVEKKLKKLPKSPGVYFHKNAKGEIIYVGKAARLNARVRQYFAPSRIRDPKTDALVAEIADIDWIETASEIDALFLEAEMVRRYMPRYNILLRDDKSYVYVRVSYNAKHPTVTLTRRPLDDKAKYYGPFASAISVKRALHFLRRAFPYSVHERSIPKRACLQFHLGLCPGLEENKTSLSDYRANLKKLMQFLSGKRTQLVRRLEHDMKIFSKEAQYEKAAVVRDQLQTLQKLTHQVIFGDREFMDISKDHALNELAELLGLPAPPARIEGFDISHHGGTDTTASMVVFASGIPYKTAYRKFKMRLPGNDDFAHMFEALSRRLSIKHRQDWGLPDLFLIDGGKGQLAAALKARDQAGLNIPMIGLAKREEEIVVHLQKSNVEISTKTLTKLLGLIKQSEQFGVLSLPENTHVIKLLQRIRDESHRFAVSYHSTLKTKRQTQSVLDDVAGIGPATRKKLIKQFGSLKAVKDAEINEVAKTIGKSKAAALAKQLLVGQKWAKKDSV